MAIDTNKFATYLRKHAAAHSQARCAKFVRLALEAGGAKTVGNPSDAKSYGPVLLRNGYRVVKVEKLATFMPMKGDIVVIQSTAAGNPAGHIQGFDGKDWISDFVQNDFWPGPVYRKEMPSYVVYRP